MGVYKSRLKSSDSSVEYSVYIYHHPDHLNDNRSDLLEWERAHTTFSWRSAVRHAEKLFRSRDYSMVEIQKVFFDRRNKRKVGKILKIYKEGMNRPVGMLRNFLRLF